MPRKSYINEGAIIAIFLACNGAYAQTSELAGTLDATQSQVGLQGNSASCGSVAITQNSTAVCPGNADRTVSSQLKLTYRMSDGTTRNECVWIDNATSKTYFVPLRSYKEWVKFTSAASGLNLQITNCTSSASCGSAASVAADYTPSTNLCSDGTTPTVSPSSGNWTWACGTNSCTAPITTPTLQAGCDVVLLLYPNGYRGLKPNDMRRANCGGYGYSSEDAIIMSVGSRLGRNLTAVGYQYWWDFGADSHTNRFSIHWTGDLDTYMTQNTRSTVSARPVPNGSYTESVTVTDTYNGNSQTLSIRAHKETEPPICSTCAQP